MRGRYKSFVIVPTRKNTTVRLVRHPVLRHVSISPSNIFKPGASVTTECSPHRRPLSLGLRRLPFLYDNVHRLYPAFSK